MEKRDLYDVNRKFTGKTIYKGEDIPKSLYILVVMIFIENADGRFLIQKRSESKGGKWATTGGHPKSGEDSRRGLLTEVKEELGLELKNEDIKLLKTKIRNNRICDIYYAKMNIDLKQIVCQKEEVSDVKLATLEEIKEMIKNEQFHKGHGKIFLSVFETEKLNQV